MNWALPSNRMSLALIRGAKEWRCPRSFSMSAPLVGRNSKKKCHSRIGSLLWNWSSLFPPIGVLIGAVFERGGGTQEEIQKRISFCLGEFLPKPFTFKEATMRGLSSGGWSRVAWVPINPCGRKFLLELFSFHSHLSSCKLVVVW